MALMRGLILIGGFTLVSLLGSVAALAATVTVSFSGTVDNIVDPFGLTTYSVNDPISGSFTIGSLSDAPNEVSTFDTRYIGDTSLIFSSIADSGHTTIDTQNILSSIGYFGIYFQSATSGLLIDFSVSGPTNTPLQSLSNLPTDLNGILSYLGGNLLSSNAAIYGGPDLAHQFSLAFTLNSLDLSVSSVATTPIPATLLLLLTALGGMALFVRSDLLRLGFHPDTRTLRLR